jgi:hypothetical protein
VGHKFNINFCSSNFSFMLCQHKSNKFSCTLWLHFSTTSTKVNGITSYLIITVPFANKFKIIISPHIHSKLFHYVAESDGEAVVRYSCQLRLQKDVQEDGRSLFGGTVLTCCQRSTTTTFNRSESKLNKFSRRHLPNIGLDCSATTLAFC